MSHRTRIRAWLAMLGILVVAAGCSSSKKASSPEVEQGTWEVRVESPLDTVEVTVGPEGEQTTAAGEPILETPVVTESAPPRQSAPEDGTPGPGASAATTAPPAQAFTPGWRVQIFASSMMVNADAMAARARRTFTEPVYVEYEPPLYKVRVGDFLSKEDARHMANRAKAENFDAWVVEDLVLRPAR